MINFIKALYSNVKGKVVVDGEQSEAFNYDGGVKQGWKRLGYRNQTAQKLPPLDGSYLSSERYQTSKSTAFGELEGSRKVGRPLLRYKDTCKMDLQRSEVLNERNTVVNDRDK